MAHRFATKPSGTLLTYQLNDPLLIDVDGSHVNVKLVAMGTYTILSETYYSHSGQASIYDIGDLIEDYLRANNKCYETFRLSLINDTGTTTDSLSLKAIHCDRYSVCTDVGYFLEQNFLTTLDTRRIAPDAYIMLPFFLKARASNARTFLCKFRRFDTSQILTYAFDIDAAPQTNDTISSVNIAVADIIYKIRTALSLDESQISLHSFTIRVDQRSATFFIDNSLLAKDSFTFKNCFNVWDQVFLPHSTTANTEAERSVATILQQDIQYDQRAWQSFETETGPLTSDEAEWLSQFVTSREITRQAPNPCDDSEPYVAKPVLITSATCEMADTDEQPNRLKITWRYADRRPHVTLAASQSIFTSPFDATYS